MGIFDRFKDQGKAKAKDISDNLEQEVNEKTGNKYTDQIDKAQQQPLLDEIAELDEASATRRIQEIYSAPIQADL
ncbi:Rv0909 family putative TA system antitoxin, partial [Streptomyces sp. NPDC059411]|uniref:Rv0909 family putative TA system antitoxin n=1 Tax=Streptomyces sp. NPDC059411 TaxID=3346825 RepID=UPI0036843875